MSTSKYMILLFTGQNYVRNISSRAQIITNKLAAKAVISANKYCRHQSVHQTAMPTSPGENRD